MDERLYQLMNWPKIEAIIYSEEDQPYQILGPQKTEQGILINAYMPTAKNIKVNLLNSRRKKPYPMEMVDEEGFFSVLVSGKKIPKYQLEVVYDNDTTATIYDPYSFELDFDEQDENRFNHGIHYEVYRKLGAHMCVKNGVQGVSFAVWAPNALRVSVVGDFNLC